MILPQSPDRAEIILSPIVLVLVASCFYTLYADKKEAKKMSEPIALSEISIIQKDTPNKIREAYIKGFDEPIYFGVHGGVKEFYGTEPETEHPSTLDHIVAAAGG